MLLFSEITLSSSSGDEDSRGSNNVRKNSSPASKPTTPASETATPGSKLTPPPTESGNSGGGAEESSQSSFGGFQIEGVTSLAVESDDTDEESDSDETKGKNGEKKV